MAFRLVSSGGNVVDPTFVNMYASGVIQRNSVVDIPIANTSGTGGFNLVSPAGSGSTTTTIFGISLDYVQGASDTQVKVIPFLNGQLWEADAVSVATTTHIGIKHQLYNNLLINNTSYNHSGAAGIFFCYAITNTSGSGKLVGEFIRNPKFSVNTTTFT